MTGGLINIVSYGAQDLFLTGTPEITYFKIVYRRHTNFSMESIRLKFEDPPDFNKVGRLTFPKNGDLIHKCYLEITLPEIYFRRELDSQKIQQLQELYNTYKSQYQIINCFMELNGEAYGDAVETYNMDNTTVQDMIDSINNVFNTSSISCSGSGDIIAEFEDVLNNLILKYPSPISNKYVLCQFFYNNLSLLDIAENTNDDTTKDSLKGLIDYAYKLSGYLVEYFQWLLVETYKELVDAQNTNYKFAWVKRLGHSIIEYANLYIGGEIIDKHYGEWIDIWYELTGNKEQEDIYLKMIGNIPEVIDFNRETKKNITILVPLIFWFNRFNGQALPIVAMQYHDIQLELKFRKFSQVAYIENTGVSFNLDNMYEDANYQIITNVLTDYVYLDTLERRKFAQSSHEYLIDVVQNHFDYANNSEYRSVIEYVNAYNHHTRTPKTGISCYSFCLNPAEVQPSGSCNLSRITITQIIMNFNDKMLFEINNPNAPETLQIKVFGLSMNILRIFDGMGALAFV